MILESESCAGDLPGLFQHHTRAVQSGIHVKGLLKMFDGCITVPQVHERKTQVCMGLGELRPKADCGFEALSGLRETSQGHERRSQIEVRLGSSRLRAQGPAEEFDGFVGPSLYQSDLPQGIVCHGVISAKSDRATGQLLCLFEFALEQAHVSQGRVGSGKIRVYGDCLLEQSLSLGVFLPTRHLLCKGEIRLLELRPPLHEFFKELGGLCRAALLEEHKCKAIL